VHEVKRDGSVSCVDWHFEGRYLAVGGEDKTVALVKTGGMMVDDNHAAAQDPIGGGESVNTTEKSGALSFDNESNSTYSGSVDTPLPNWVMMDGFRDAAAAAAAAAANGSQITTSKEPNNNSHNMIVTNTSTKSKPEIITITNTLFSRGAKYLAITTNNATLIIISTEDWRPVTEHSLPSPPSALSWSSTSHFLAIATNTTLTILSTPSFSPLFTTNLSSEILSLSFSPFSSHLAIGLHDGRLSLLSSSTWSIVGEMEEEESEIPAVDWSESMLAVARLEGRVTVHEVESVLGNFFVPTFELNVDAQVTCLAFGRGGGYLAVGTDDSTISIYHVSHQKRGKLAQKLKLDGSSVLCLTWSPDGRYIAIGTTAPNLIILNTLNYTPTTLPRFSTPPHVSFSDNSKYLAASSDKLIVILSTPTFSPLRTVNVLDEYDDDDEPPAAKSLSDTTSTNKTPQNNVNNVQSILDDLAAESPNPASSYSHSQSQSSQQQHQPPQQRRKKKITGLKQEGGWSQRHEITSFLETAEAFLSPYEFDHPPRDIRLFVASILMLQWHVKWISSLQSEVRESVAMQDDGEPLNSLCRILRDGVSVMERIMEDEEGVTDWFFSLRLFELGRGDVRRLMAWNSWWRQCYGDAPLVDVGLLQRVEDQGRTTSGGAGGAGGDAGRM